MFCKNCGAEINDNAVICVKCGCATTGKKINIDPNISEKNALITLLLCIFVGCLGIHRFYVGKIGTGVLQLITCGGCGIWTLIDLILICTGSFKDEEGKIVKL